MNAPHAFTPDLLGDCAACPLPLDNPIHREAQQGWDDNGPAYVGPDTAVLPPETHARKTDPGTSHAAAHELTDKAAMLRRLLNAYTYSFANAVGMTAEEAAEFAGYGPEDGAWKRVSDLKRLGWIEPTGTTRPGSSGRQQAVCRITDSGRQALR